MRKIVLFATVLCSLLFCGLHAGNAQPQPPTHRSTLDHPTEIQGYPCDKGYVWF